MNHPNVVRSFYSDSLTWLTPSFLWFPYYDFYENLYLDVSGSLTDLRQYLSSHCYDNDLTGWSSITTAIDFVPYLSPYFYPHMYDRNVLVILKLTLLGLTTNFYKRPEDLSSVLNPVSKSSTNKCRSIKNLQPIIVSPLLYLPLLFFGL